MIGGLGGARRELIAERRILDRLDPAVRLAESRERAGLLLDRATRATLARVATARATEERRAPVASTRSPRHAWRERGRRSTPRPRP